MKILLISDIPPCDDFTAGIVLSAMIRFLPRGTICCFAVVNPLLPLRMSSEFSSIPVEFHRKPVENWSWLPGAPPLGKFSSMASSAAEDYIGRSQVEPLIERAVAFGREQQVDRVWAVLQGQTTIRMALAVAQRLNVPLHSQVWDPFSWWVRANRIGDRTARDIQDLFDATIRGSAAVATASQPMAELYRDRFDVKALPVILGCPVACTPPALAIGESLVIGMAGQFYAADEWLQLLRVLESVHWTVAGRRVSIVAMGPTKPPSAYAHVTFLGWKPQPEALKLLSGFDLLYCPYPFDPAMREVAEFSFPSKLVLYLAAGRPVLFHGPDFSAPAHYIASKGCGIVVTDLAAATLLTEIERLVGDRSRYAETAAKAQAAFREDFTLESMARSVHDFIGADADGAATLHDHAARRGEPPQPDQLSPAQRRSLLVLAVRCGKMVRRLARLPARLFGARSPSRLKT